jgi:dTDP-4-dehydrorhamnose reductase
MIADITAQLVARYLAGRKRLSFSKCHLRAFRETNWSDCGRHIVMGRGFELSLRVSDIEPGPVKRPANSRFDCSRLASMFGISLPDWLDSLNYVLSKYTSDAGTQTE